MVRVKIDINLSKIIPKIQRKVRQQITPSVMFDLIVNKSIAKGVSPVQGARFPAYSQTYRTAIQKGRFKQFSKGIAPINLKLSGALHDSFFANRTSKGVTVGFTSALADIHNRQGAGKSKTIRRLLPTRTGEQFNNLIQNFIFRTINKIVAMVVKEEN